MAGRTFSFIIAALAASAAVPVAGQAQASLERVIAFDNPADPWLSEGSNRIFQSAWTPASTGIAVPGVGFTRIAGSTDATTGWTRSAMPLKGDWHGLSMTGFALSGMPHSGVGAYELSFADAPQRTLARLKALGYPLTAVGREVTTGDAECGTKLRVESSAGGSRFRIAFAC